MGLSSPCRSNARSRGVAAERRRSQPAPHTSTMFWTSHASPRSMAAMSGASVAMASDCWCRETGGVVQNNGSMASAAASSLVDIRQRAVTEYLTARPIGSLVLALTRNKNNNFVAYCANVGSDGSLGSPALHVFWMDIDAAYIKRAAAARKDGIPRSELNWLERSVFGVSTKAAAVPRPREATVHFHKHKRPLTLRVVSGRPCLIGKVNGKRAYVRRMHVHETMGWTGPSVTGVTLFGTDVMSGKEVSEFIANNAS